MLLAPGERRADQPGREPGESGRLDRECYEIYTTAGTDSVTIDGPFDDRIQLGVPDGEQVRFENLGAKPGALTRT